MREALTLSRNPVAVQLWLKYDADSYHRAPLAIRDHDADFALSASAIGASEVQLLEFVAAFTALDNLGTPVTPRCVYRVEDASGKTLWTQEICLLSPPALDPRACLPFCVT